MAKKEMIAMILAGGQGSRLKALTSQVAKPAVAFGGKYKIIDFVLSNCANSGIDTIGILTQYKPWALNSHIGVGKAWDLDVANGGVSVLPPYMGESGGDWYKGTADAIYQNLGFMDGYEPEYVLILSGDHIYKMDYSKMLDYHIKKGADATIAVIDVPYHEASRFGIMNVEDGYKINEFEEKPPQPKSTLASMGIYIFSYPALKKYLQDDAVKEGSAHDFGKNIIPQMLNDGKGMYAYPFDGYWRDIGTIDSIWEANMDLINPDNELNLYNDDWKIYSNVKSKVPQFIGDNAEVKNSIISEGAVILGKVENSVIFPGVYVAEDAVVKNSVVMEDCRILSNCQINKAIVGTKAVINGDNYIGDGEEVLLIENDINIKAGEYKKAE
jgi:glucose-1-phosphate adenylyltransferase